MPRPSRGAPSTVAPLHLPYSSPKVGERGKGPSAFSLGWTTARGHRLPCRCTAWDAPTVNGLLQPADLVDDPHEATTVGREHVLDFDGRLFAEYGAAGDAEADHLAEPLVHDLCGQARGRSEQGAGPTAPITQMPKQSNGPLASDDALDHRGDRNGLGIVGRECRMSRQIIVDHRVRTLPEGAFLAGSRGRGILLRGWCARPPRTVRPPRTMKAGS